MRVLALILVLSAGLAQAQSEPTQTAPATAAAVAEAAGGDVVDQLVKELAITPAQAQGAAGALFGVAKTKLSADDFGKLAGAVPNMDALLKAAPAPDMATSALSALTTGSGSSGLGALGAVAGVAGSLNKLGLKPETIAKLAPTLVKAVESKGGTEVGKLLAGALK
jgi:DNA-binding transcriptional regulator YdaS (Cro superfamily)